MRPSIESIALRRNSVESITIKRKPRAVSSFLKKTFELLNDVQNNEIVRWSLSGVGFIVVNEDRFSRQILPKYFKHSNYSSFVRQLNMYNFHKIRESNSQSFFHHESFDRDHQYKMSEIKRKPEKKKRKFEYSDDQNSEKETKNVINKISIHRQKKEVSLKILNTESSEKKVGSQKNTRHIFSQEYHQQEVKNSKNWIEDGDDDKISINNEIFEHIPRLATRELIYPSNHNLFPFFGGVAQASTFCLFH